MASSNDVPWSLEESMVPQPKRAFQSWELMAIACPWLAIFLGIALIWAPVPWVLPGAEPFQLPPFGGYALGFTFIGTAIIVLGATVLVLFSWRPVRLVGGVLGAVALLSVLWMWSLVVSGSFHRETVLERNKELYQRWSEACLRANTLPTMRERREAAASLPHPPSDWTSQDACRDLQAEVTAFDNQRACPRWLPTDACRCGGLEWPTQRPTCEGRVVCWLSSETPYELSGHLECER